MLYFDKDMDSLKVMRNPPDRTIGGKAFSGVKGENVTVPLCRKFREQEKEKRKEKYMTKQCRLRAIIGRYSGLLFAMLCMVLLSGFQSYAADFTGSIQSALINQYDTRKINVSAVLTGTPATADNRIYLFEIAPYEKDLGARTDYIESRAIGENLTFTVDVFKNPGAMRIYDAFVLAVQPGVGQPFQIISNRCYVSNPEMIAPDQTPAVNRGKKGLMVDPNILQDAISLNIKHASIAISTELLFGKGISYTHEGINYELNLQYVNLIDQQVKTLTANGISVTAVLLNGWNDAYPQLYRPGQTKMPSDAAVYYSFNVETEQGFRMVKALASFMAKRYNGRSGYGKIQNWVIGNELNNQYWNYAGNMDVASYTLLYQRTFRVFYAAIKSVCANDDVMFSIDNYWNSLPESGSVGKYKGRDILEYFNYFDMQEGRTDWALALHPYSYPLHNPAFWDDLQSGKCNDTNDTPVISFANLHVATDFMQNATIRKRNGEVRNIYLTEQGFTAMDQGTDTSVQQAVAVAYSHYIADANPYIKAYMLSRQLDHATETKDGLALGLSYADPATGALVYRPAHDVFKYIDDPAMSQSVSDFAKPYLGIISWSQLIPGFHLPQ